MIQTKTQSMVEAVTNIGIGFVISLSVQLIWFPAIGHELTLFDNVSTTIVFTLVSFLRSYVVRRGFNYVSKRQIK